MVKKINARIQSLLETAKNADEYLKSNLNPSELVLLNGSGPIGFFERQVRELHLQTALKLNRLFKLGLKIDEKNLEESHTILPNVVDAIHIKLKNEKTVTIKHYKLDIEDTMTALNHLLSKQDSLIKDLFYDIHSEIRTAKTADLLRSIAQPFVDIWEYIKHKVTTLYAAAEEYLNKRQTTHISYVHKSVKKSMDALDGRNPWPVDSKKQKQLNESVYKEVLEHIKKMPVNGEKEKNLRKWALNTLDRAYHDTAVEPHSGRTIMETLTTVWIAAKDHHAYDPNDSEQDMNNRLNTICRHLALAEREYNTDAAGIDDGRLTSGRACRGGTVNKLVEALEMIHPDVRIIRGIDIISDYAIEMLNEEFANLKPEQQILVVDEKDEAEEILSNIYKIVAEKLSEINKEIFDGDIPQNKLREYVDNLQYVKIKELPITKEHNEKKELEKQKEQQAKQQEQPPWKAFEIDGREINAKEIDVFIVNYTLQRSIPMFKSQSDDLVAKRVVKNQFEEAFWDKDDNLDQLVKALLNAKMKPKTTPVVEEVSGEVVDPIQSLVTSPEKQQTSDLTEANGLKSIKERLAKIKENDDVAPENGTVSSLR